MSVVTITVAVRDQVAAGLTGIRTRFNSAMTSVQSHTTSALTAVRDRFDTTMTAVQTRVQAGTSQLQAAWTSASSAVSSAVTNLTGRWNGFGDAASEAMRGAITLAPALLPMAASLATVATAAVGAVGALGLFGAALIPQAKAIAEAVKAEGKYSEAVDASGASSKEAAKAGEAYGQSLSALPPATQAATRGFLALKREFMAWSDSLSESTMPVATKGFSVLRDIFPKFTPLVAQTGEELSKLMDRLKVGVNSSAFDRTIEKFNHFAIVTLRKVLDGMTDLGARVAAFGAGGGFDAFLGYAREHGPIVADTLKNLAIALGNILSASSGLGSVMLGIVNGLSQLLAAVPPGLITVLANLAAALSLIRFEYGIYALMGAGIASLATQLTALGLTAPAVARVSLALRGLQGAVGVVAVLFTLKTAVDMVSAAFAPAPPKVDKLAASLQKFQQDGKATGEAARLFGEDLRGLGEDVKRLAEDGAWAALRDALPGGDKFTEEARRELGAYDEALSQLVRGGNIEGASAAFRLVSTAAHEQGIALSQVKEMFPQYAEALADAEAQQLASARAMGMFGETAQEVTGALKEQRLSADALKTALDGLNGTNLSLNDTQRATQAAIDESTASLKEHGRTLDIDTAAGRANSAALDAIARAAMEESEATLTATGSNQAAIQVLRTARDELIRQAQQYGMTADQARQYADKVLAIPKSLTTDVNANTSEANARIETFRSKIDSLRDRSVTIRTIYESRYDPATQSPFGTGRAIGGPIGAYANGGSTGAGSAMALVGEQGPELVRLPYGSSVIPAGQSRQMLTSPGASAPVVLEIRSGGSRLDDLLVELLRNAIRTRGGNVQLVLGKG